MDKTKNTDRALIKLSAILAGVALTSSVAALGINEIRKYISLEKPGEAIKARLRDIINEAKND